MPPLTIRSIPDSTDIPGDTTEVPAADATAYSATDTAEAPGGIFVMHCWLSVESAAVDSIVSVADATVAADFVVAASTSGSVHDVAPTSTSLPVSDVASTSRAFAWCT